MNGMEWIASLSGRHRERVVVVLMDDGQSAFNAEFKAHAQLGGCKNANRTAYMNA